MLSLSDSLYAYLVAIGAESMPTIADAGFIAGPPLIALAALTPRADLGTGNAPQQWRSDRTQLLLPYLLIAVIATLVTVQALIVGNLDVVVVILGVVVLVLALVRQILTLLENDALLQQISAAQDELRYRAHHDPLTQLANRAAFDEHFASAIDDYRHTKSERVLMLVDLDDFKQVNDRYGHPAGDRLLVVSQSVCAKRFPRVHSSLDSAATSSQCSCRARSKSRRRSSKIVNALSSDGIAGDDMSVSVGARCRCRVIRVRVIRVRVIRVRAVRVRGRAAQRAHSSSPGRCGDVRGQENWEGRCSCLPRSPSTAIVADTSAVGVRRSLPVNPIRPC